MRSLTENWSKLFVLGLLCVVISLIEKLFPPVLLYVRLGLANIVFLVMLPFFRLRFLSIVLLLKILIPALILGSFGSLAFILSAISSLGSFIVMFFFLALIKGFSRISVSMLASIVNISLQIIVVSIYLDVNGMFLFKVLYIPAVIAGSITGLLSELTVKKLENIGFYDNKK